jgi:hypothetical protein
MTISKTGLTKINRANQQHERGQFIATDIRPFPPGATNVAALNWGAAGQTQLTARTTDAASALAATVTSAVAKDSSNIGHANKKKTEPRPWSVASIGRRSQSSMRWISRTDDISEPATTMTNHHIASARIPRFLFEERFESRIIAGCTKLMRWFSIGQLFLRRIGDDAGSQLIKFIALLLCIPCFKASHFFFKIAYSLNQRRLRRLCSEDFFLKFYDGLVPSGSVVNILNALRNIHRRLEGANAHHSFCNDHKSPPSR